MYMRGKPFFITMLIGIMLFAVSCVLAFFELAKSFRLVVWPALFLLSIGLISGSFLDIILIGLYSAYGKRQLTVRKSGKMFFALFCIGLAVLLIGLYFFVVKAGIPYQDPTAEMQRRWEFYLKLGEGLSVCGCAAFSGGIIGGVLCCINKLRKDK